MTRRMSLSAPSSQLHLSPQIPEHTDTEQIDSTFPRRLTSGSIAVIPKVERPGRRSSTASTSSSSISRGWDAAAESSVHGVHPLRAPFLVLEAALALLRASENDIGEDDDGHVVVFGVPLPQVPPARLMAHDHPAMEVRGGDAVSWSLPPATRVGSRYHLHRRS